MLKAQTKLDIIISALSKIKVGQFQRDISLVDEALALFTSLKPIASYAEIILKQLFEPLIAALEERSKECSKNILSDIILTKPLPLFEEGGAGGGGEEYPDDNKDTPPEMKVEVAKGLKPSNNYKEMNLATKVVHFAIVMGLVFEWRKDIMARQKVDFLILDDALKIMAWLHRMSNEEWQRLFETHLPWRLVVRHAVEIGQSE
jgi:hypothetical protein